LDLNIHFNRRYYLIRLKKFIQLFNAYQSQKLKQKAQFGVVNEKGAEQAG
jgi:hypothetical protein